MLNPNGPAIAAEVLSACDSNTEKATQKLLSRIKADESLHAEALEEAARAWVRHAASRQRLTSVSAAVKLVQMEKDEARTGRPDNTRGLELIAERGLLDTFVLLGEKRLGDATHEDIEAYVDVEGKRARTAGLNVSRAKALLKDPKFKKGKRVRDCLSDLEVARIFGRFAG
jgi:hypothetical protein